jgi:hypothetical protein
MSNGLATPISDQGVELAGLLDGSTPDDLLPATGSYPAETVRYQTVVLTEIPGGGGELAELAGPVDLGAGLDGHGGSGYTRPAQGVIVTTEQTWTAQGVTLGRLLHSLALAPGESTKLAVIDWERRTRGTGEELTREADTLGSATDQDRSISELADTVAREEQHGSSATATESSSSSAGFSAGIAGANWGLGGSASSSSNRGRATAVSRSSGSRSVTADTAQRISARTKQLATAVRSRHMAVVRETSQDESATGSTRVVTNYNHMHAMSVQYYEVIQSYRVTTRPVQVERCLFIPMQELTFTADVLKRYGPVLAEAAPRVWADRIRGTDPFDVSTVRIAASSEDAATGLRVQRYDSVVLRDLSAGPGGLVFGVANDGTPMRFEAGSGTWQPMTTAGLPSSSLRKITVGDAATMWAIDADGSIVRWWSEDGSWQRDPAGGRARDITVGADGTLYCIGIDAPVIYRREGNAWQELRDTGATDVAVCNAQRVWHAAAGGQTYELADNRSNWIPRGFPPAITQMAGSQDGSIWGVTTGQEIYRVRVGSSEWVRFTAAELPPASLVAPVTDNDFWLLDATSNPVHVTQRAALTPFDDPTPPDAGGATRIELWWDTGGIRGIALSMPGGQRIRRGQTSGADLAHAAVELSGVDKLRSVGYWNGPAAGGSLRGLRLVTVSGAATDFGPAVGEAEPDSVEDAGGSALCGVHGSTVVADGRTYLASLGFYLRGAAVAQGVLDHLNDNRSYYSQVIWANADELTLSRMLAHYRYAAPGTTDTAPLGTRLDPMPVAISANYLGFRWNFGSEEERAAWLVEHPLGRAVGDTIGVATNGVFAEAVLGRANAAEKIDLTRFWNWKDSPIPILPPDIAPVSTASRHSEVDVAVGALSPTEARLQALSELPAPTGMDASLRALSTANLFRDMSGLAGASGLLTNAIQAAATNDQAAAQNATAAMKIATEHMQRMAELAIQAAPMLLGPEGAALTGALGGTAAGGASGGLLGGLLSGPATASLTGLGGVLNQPALRSSAGAPAQAHASGRSGAARPGLFDALTGDVPGAGPLLRNGGDGPQQGRATDEYSDGPDVTPGADEPAQSIGEPEFTGTVLDWFEPVGDATDDLVEP